MSGPSISLESRAKGLLRRRELSTDEWEQLAQAVVDVVTEYLAEYLDHDAETEVLEVLDDVVEIDCDELERGRVTLIFHEHWPLGAVCGYHWYVIALASCWDAITSLFADRGQVLRGPRPDADAEYQPSGSYALAVADATLLAVSPSGEVLVSAGDGEGEVIALDDERLDGDARDRAQQVHDSGLCQCSLCVALRPASVVGKPAAERRPAQADAPPYVRALQAAQQGDIAALDRALDAGDIDGERALEHAAGSHNAATVRHLLDRGVPPTADAAANAARYNAVEALRALHGAGLGLEAHDEMGRTPLMNAAMYGSVEAAEYLIGAGADVNARDAYDGDTALLLAITDDSSDDPVAIIAVLIAAGAAPDAKNHAGNGVGELLAYIDDTALQAAIRAALASGGRDR